MKRNHFHSFKSIPSLVLALLILWSGAVAFSGSAKWLTWSQSGASAAASPASLVMPHGNIWYVSNQMDGFEQPGSWSETSSLRATVSIANNGDTIVFRPDVTGTCLLTFGPIVIDKDLTIIGPGADKFSISGNKQGQVFDVQNVSATISGLSIVDGYSYFGGAGIRNNGGTLTLINCTVSGNLAQYGGGPLGGGGGIENDEGTLTLINCTVSGNSAGNEPIISQAGGIGNKGGTLTLINCTVSGNSAQDGAGGIGNYWGILTLTNCTVSGNSAQKNGGGIFNMNGTATCLNTLIAGNTAPSAPDVSGFFTSSGHNLIGKSDGCTGFTSRNHDIVGTSSAPVDPKIAALANYGGPTKTHALLAYSPALDAGDSTLELPTDQRGYFRRIGSAVDIGACEAQ